MLNKTILLVDGDLGVRNLVSDLFVREGYSVLTSDDGKGVEDIVSTQNVGLVIMDINLSDANGLLLAKDIKQSNPNIAIIFLTSSSKEVDKILALEYGADHFMTKPFSVRELTIRVRNLFSRINCKSQESLVGNHQFLDSYSFNNWTLDVNSRSLIAPDSNSYRLAKSEFRALVFLIKNQGKIMTRSDLLHQMTGRVLKEKDRTVDVTIRRIRKHFESHTGTPEIIATIHGEGYRFCGDLV